jgi:hypothetical protein
VDKKWTIDGQEKKRCIVHMKTQWARRVQGFVDNVDNEFLTSKNKENNVSYM